MIKKLFVTSALILVSGIALANGGVIVPNTPTYYSPCGFYLGVDIE